MQFSSVGLIAFRCFIKATEQHHFISLEEISYLLILLQKQTCPQVFIEDTLYSQLQIYDQ